METITTTTEENSTDCVSESITAEQINMAFERMCDKMEAVAQSTCDWAMACVIAGEMLRKKREEFPATRGGWFEWLSANCPDINHRMSQRLMSIAALFASGGTPIGGFPERLSSVRDLHQLLKDAVEQPDKTPAQPSGPTPSKVIASLSRFWGAVTRRPPETWDEIERSEFLTDLAEREKIRNKHGWDLPAIDVESETLN